MDQLIVLGTGNAQAIRYYNTCFLLKLDGGYILCDAGGGNGILKQLKDSHTNWNDIHHLIITHAHSDHMLGVLWVIRMVATAINEGSYEGKLHIYCDETIRMGMTALCRLSLQPQMHSHIGKDILFHGIRDGSEFELFGRKLRFFDILSTKMLQYGFTITLWNKEKLCCLGDEPFNPDCRNHVKGSSWLLCEAFCLYEERTIFKPYEKNHSTVKEACELAEALGVSSLVIWHTEDSHTNRKQLYSEEGKQYFHGRLFVPDDLEVLNLD